MAEGLLPQCQEAMTAIEGALQYFWAFANCCNIGSNAELRLKMEDGQLNVNMSAYLGPVRPQSDDGLWLGLHKANNSQSRRRDRRAARRAAAATEEVCAGSRKVAEVSAAKAEANEAVTAAEKAATKRTVGCAAEQVAAIVAEEATAKIATAEEVTAVGVSEKVPVEKATDERVILAAIATEVDKTLADGDCVATTSQCVGKVTCWNCNGVMSQAHQCEEKVEEDSSCLPLCHYCCHRGSGEYPVHYFMQCLCDDRKCSCICYCTEAQIEHKQLHFPGGFGGRKPVAPGDRLRARTAAEARANSKPCTDISCVKWWKDDNAKCK